MINTDYNKPLFHRSCHVNVYQAAAGADAGPNDELHRQSVSFLVDNVCCNLTLHEVVAVLYTVGLTTYLHPVQLTVLSSCQPTRL